MDPPDRTADQVWMDDKTDTTVNIEEASGEFLPRPVTARVVKPSKRSSAGLGLEFDPKGYLVVASLAKGGLMEREGSLKAGMRVLEINGVVMKPHTTKALSILQNGQQQIEVVAQPTTGSRLLEAAAQAKKRKKQEKRKQFKKTTLVGALVSTGFSWAKM